MENKNTLLCFFISIFLIFLAFSPNLKADTLSNSLENAQKLADLGIIQDNSKNPSNYNLDSGISRREMLKVILNIAGVSVGNSCEGKFSDLGSSDWGCKYAETALKLGYISANKNFRPNDAVSKAESLKMLFKAKNIEVENTKDWREGYVKKAYELGYSDKFFDYDAPAKRSFVFNVGAKAVNNHNITTPGNDLMCLQVITPAINKETGECINFPNSCIPENFEKTDKCVPKESLYKKSKLIFAFNEEMNKTSVEENVKIFPELKYTSSWKDEKTLELTLNDILNKELEVLINVMDKAALKNGENLGETISKKYKIGGTPIVDFVSPEGQLTDKNQNITVRFSKPVVSLTNLDNQAPCPITITPALPGKCVWITTSTFQFRPEKGFPAGARYTVLIPAGVETIAGDKTLESKTFEIVTPEFKLLSKSETLKNDEKLNFLFNDEVSLEDFKKNFSINGISESALNFEYLQIPTSIEGKFDTNKAGVSVFPKSGNWGYNKNYNFSISSSMKSERGNIGLGKSVNLNLKIEDFLNEYYPAILNDVNAKEPYLETNILRSANPGIITKNNPSIVFKFEKEVDLDNSLFTLNFPFSLNYIKTRDYTDYNNQKIIENKKQIVLTINGNIENNLNIKINLSKYGSDDKNINFQTKEENKIISYNQINYKKACLTTQNPLGNNINYKSFEFDKYGKISYIYQAYEYSNDKDCKYEVGKNKYIVNTQTNPESENKLTIKKSLLDQDNYPLDKDYAFTFKTGKTLNEDKSISIMDAREYILVPKSINPLSISISSINLNKANVNICEGDFEITESSKIKNEKCIKKTINITNLGFKTNISVIDLKNLYGKEFSKNYIKIEVSKLDEDKTDYEKKNDNYNSKASFIISDISAVIKSGEKGVLWLRDFNTGENLDDQVEKIESYIEEADYSIFGQYKGTKYVFDKNINFSFLKDGLYQVDKANGNLLITLTSGEKVYVGNTYYYENDNRITTYLSTDKPIYKSGEKVNIKGVSRILNATGYKLNTGKIKLTVQDSKYKEIFNQEVSLNTLGAFDVNIDLKSDASLGTYYIYAGNNSLSFLVEEYEKPDFKIEAKSREKNYLSEQTALIDISGEYYIGMPLSNGEGTYNITSTNYYFDGGKTNGYIWGENNYIWWRNSYDYQASSFYKNGNFTLSNDGKYTLRIEGDTNSTSDKIYSVSTTITDPNTKKSISTNTDFISTRSDTFLGLKLDKYYYDFKDTAKLSFASVDIVGNKKGNTSFEFRVYKIDYKYNESTYEYEEEEKLLTTKTLKTENSGLTNESYTFDDYGEYRFEIETSPLTNGGPRGGSYKTSKTLYISGGNILKPIEGENQIEILSNKDEYNVGENAEIIISSPETGVKALLTIEKLNEVLDAKIVDINEFNQKVNLPIKKELIPNFNVGVYIIKDIKTNSDKLEELKNIRAEMLKLEQELQKEQENIVIPYTIFDIKILPTITNENLNKDLLSKLANLRFKENDILSNILPKYYTGNKEIKVNTKEIVLNTKVTLDKKSYLPGDKEIIDLNITDNSGKPINGQVTLKIIDESLLALKNNNTSIKDFFYSNVSNEINTNGNIANIIRRIDFNKVQEKERGLDLGGATVGSASFAEESSAGIDDLYFNISKNEMVASDMAMPQASPAPAGGDNPLETKIRTEFKDLAYYKGTIEVKDGKAQIVVDKLPDNLTTWVISGFAHTNDTKVGEIETSFKVQKNLSILPQIPRFFINGDIAKIGGLVVNNTSNPLNIEANLEMTNAIISQPKQNIQVPANSQKLVEFEVEITNQENVLTESLEYFGVSSTNIKLNVKNSNSSLSDTIILEKPIYQENSGEYVFTNGSTNNLSYEEKIYLPTYLDKNGYVEISLGASILTNLLQNLDKILSFPYDDLYSKLVFLENSSILEKLYKNAGEEEKFKNFTLKDFNGKTYSISQVNELVKNDIKNYLQSDNGLSYFKNCQTSFYYPSCSSYWVTGKYLSLGIQAPGINNKNVIDYYKKELTKNIEERKSAGIMHTEIKDFLPLAVQKETSYINTYFKPNDSLSNIEKVNYIKLYNILGNIGSKTEIYLRDLRNSLIIEARGTFLPGNSDFYQNNSYSTAAFLEILLEKNIGDKLETENLARWLLSQRNEEGAYYIDSIGKILSALSLYIEKNESLNNINFEGKAFLNSNEIMNSKFNTENKFSIDKEKFPLEGNITFGQENSLGFEKIGTGKLYYDVGVRYFLPNSKLEAREEGIIVSRNYYKYEDYKNAFKKECFNPWWLVYSYENYCIETKTKEINPITNAKKGDLIVGEIEVTVTQERTNVVVNDFLPAGAEILNTIFDTTSVEVKDVSGNKSDRSFYYGFNHVEQKDNMVYLFANHLKPGTYKYTYVLKANYAGKYSLKPAIAELLDKPEVWGRSNGSEFEIK